MKQYFRWGFFYSLSLLIFLVVIWCGFFLKNNNKAQVKVLASSVSKNEENQKPVPLNTSTEIPKKPILSSLSAQSALSWKIVNSKKQVLFEKNPKKKIYIASLSKIMTAMIVSDRYDLTKKVTISKENVWQGGYIGAGESFSVDTLLHVALIESDNSAAQALSDVIGREKFAGLMNKKAKELGLLNTHFYNAIGAGYNYSNSEDLAKLLQVFFEKYPKLAEITSSSEYKVYNYRGKFHHTAHSTNKLLIDDSVSWKGNIVAGKTGSNENVKEHLMIMVKTGGGYLVNVVLGSSHRFIDMKDLMKFIGEN